MSKTHLDFAVESIPRHKVCFYARAIRTLIDPDAYSSSLINAEGERVYRIVYDQTQNAHAQIQLAA